MISFFGDFDTTETVYIPFNTFSSDDPSASVTITNLAAADIEIHKDGSTTQRASDNGVTVTIDFDSITGNHMVAIDLSDNSDAGYYANGSQYAVRMEGTTVDGATINAWIGSFSIGRTLRPTTNGRKLDVETGGCAGIDWGNVANKTTANDLSATDIQLCDTVTTLTGHTAQTGDSFARLGAPAGASVSADIATVDGNVDSILTDTGTTLENHLTDIKGTGFAKDTHSLTDIEGYADLIDDGTSGLAKIATDVAAILVDTGTTLDGKLDTIDTNVDAILVDTGTDGVIVATNNDKTGYGLANDAITSAKYDETTAFPVVSADTGATQIARVGADGDTLETLSDQIDAVPTAAENRTEMDSNSTQLSAIVADTNELQTDLADGGRLDLLIDAIKALLDDARTEPGQGAPPVNPDLATKVDYLYKAWRNKMTSDSDSVDLYNDAGDTVDQKRTISDDGSTFTKGEMGSGA